MGEFPVRIASYNLRGSIARERHYVPRRVAGVLSELDVGIIALQDIESTKVGGLDALGYFAQKTDCTAIEGPALKSGPDEHRNGLLTRYPVQAVRWIDLGTADAETCGAIDAELDCGGWQLRVVAAQLGSDPAMRRAQAGRLLDLLDNDGSVVTVLTGDINEWLLWGKPRQQIRAQFEKTPAPRTFPSSFPLFALDRIWVKPRRALRRMDVHATRLARRASVHLPVVAEIDRRTEPRPLQR